MNRSFRLGKAYVDRVRDAIDDKLTDAEKGVAKDELDRDPGDAPDTFSRGNAYDNDPDALMRRAEERIAAARRSADASLELARARSEAANPTTRQSDSTSAPQKVPTSAEDPDATDYKVLGLEPASDYPSVQAAYEKLAARCDPRRFPDGSAEQKQAEVILARVNTAYENLRKRLSPTESRFAKLEL
ncbi:MAG: J domain-containing protein [Akkermansiaceae bacterium]|nr:J domain-containing protein [Armatimonadota bacterium]